MPKILFYTYLVISILIVVAISIILIQNLVLNYKIKRRQGVNKFLILSSKLSLNIALFATIIILTFVVTENRNNIYMSLYGYDNTSAICIDFGDDYGTPEDSMISLNYVGIITVIGYEAKTEFDFLKEDNYVIPYDIKVYSVSEIDRSIGENEIENIYDRNYLVQEGIYITDVCDPILDLQNEGTYFVFGNYVFQDSIVENYSDASYIFKAVQITGYDVMKTPENQSPEIVDLLTNLGYFYNQDDE